MLNDIKITDITKTKKGFNALFSDGEFLFSVDDAVLYQNNIRQGSCFSRQELGRIEKQSLRSKAVDKCYTLLGARMHSKKELYDKLCRSFEPDDAGYAVEKMEELGLVDDYKFAVMKADYMLRVKKASFYQVKLKLLSLGVDKDIAESVLLSFGADSQVEDIIYLLKTKYSSKLSDPKKTVASLARKGFKYNEIRQALSRLDIDLQEY